MLTVWRANLLGSSGKGNEYFLRHLLGTDTLAAGRPRRRRTQRPRDVTWHEEAPEGKLDLLLSLDFRMTSTTIFSDVVLPAATWYEKHDLNTTDMHPFVHSFNPAIAPPWQTRTDFDAFQAIAETFSELADDRTSACARTWSPSPLLHDTPDEMANPHGVVRDWKAGECEPVPGRDDAEARRGRARLRRGRRRRWRRSARCWTRLGATTKGVTFDVTREVDVPARARTARCAAASPTAGRR